MPEQPPENLDSLGIARLQEIVTKQPADPAFMQLAVHYLRAGQFTLAVDVCQSALAVAPDHLMGRLLLGRSLMGLRRFREAQNEFQAAIQISPGRGESHRLLGEALVRAGDFERALSALQEAKRLDPSDSRAQLLLNRIEGAGGASAFSTLPPGAPSG